MKMMKILIIIKEIINKIIIILKTKNLHLILLIRIKNILNKFIKRKTIINRIMKNSKSNL